MIFSLKQDNKLLFDGKIIIDIEYYYGQEKSFEGQYVEGKQIGHGKEE